MTGNVLVDGAVLTAGGSTLQAIDTIKGNGANDTMRISYVAAAGAEATQGAVISGVENFEIRNTTDGQTVSLNASLDAGLTRAVAYNSVGNVTVTNLASGAKGAIVGDGTLTNGDSSFSWVDTATAAVIDVTGGTTAGDVTVGAGAALTSTTINSLGATANTVGDVAALGTTLTVNAAANLTTGAITGAALTKLVVTGAGNVNTSTTALPTTVATVDASTSTGNVTVVTGDTAAGTLAAPGLTVTTNTGADSVDIRASTAATDYVSVSTGAGNDTVKVLATQITTGSTLSLNGGTGVDTLLVDFGDTGSTQAIDLSTLITNFDTINATSATGGAAITATLAMGTNKLPISNFVWSGAAADTFTLTGLAANSSINLTTGLVALNATIGTDTAADVLNLTLGTTAAGVTATALTTATNYNTVNVTSQGGANVLTGLTAATGNVVISGNQNLTTGTITTKASGSVNASAMTAGTLTATLTSATTSFTGGAGADVLTLGAGTLAQGYSYNGGAGANTIAVTASAAQNAGILDVSNFTTVAVTMSGAAVDTETFDLRNVSNVGNFTVASGNAGDNLTINHLPAAQTLTLLGTTAFGTVNLNLNSGTTQSLAIGDSLTVATLNADAGATSLTLSEVAAKTATFTNAIGGGSLTTLTLTGAGSFSLGGTQAANLTTIDGSQLSAGTLTATLGAAGTLKGGAGGDTLNGSSGADTIIGGLGADTIKTNGGLDTLTGGDTTSQDIFKINGAVAGSATSQVTITDFATAAMHTATPAIVADALQISQTTVAGNGTPTINAGATNLTTAASLADALNLLSVGNGSVNSIVAYGTYNGDTYVVVDNTAAGTLNAADAVIKLTGVTNLAAADIAIIA